MIMLNKKFSLSLSLSYFHRSQFFNKIYHCGLTFALNFNKFIDFLNIPCIFDISKYHFMIRNIIYDDP